MKALTIQRRPKVRRLRERAREIANTLAKSARNRSLELQDFTPRSVFADKKPALLADLAIRAQRLREEADTLAVLDGKKGPYDSLIRRISRLHS